MPLQEFQQVRLLSDRSVDEGVAAGAQGTILEVFDDGYIVEFSRPDGTTISWFGVALDEVEAVSDVVADLPRRAAG